MSINAQDLIDNALNSKDIKYLAKAVNDVILGFPRKPVLDMENEVWTCNYSWQWVSFGKLKITEFDSKPWDECIYEAKVDNSIWIGKLCWFSQDNMSDSLARLIRINKKNGQTTYTSEYSFEYYHCRPVKRNEVEFAEDE